MTTAADRRPASTTAPPVGAQHAAPLPAPSRPAEIALIEAANVDFCCPWPLELKDGPEAEHLTETVAHLPGFERLKTGFRIAPDAPLSEENLRTLGDVLLKLATHYSQECL